MDVLAKILKIMKNLLFLLHNYIYMDMYTGTCTTVLGLDQVQTSLDVNCSWDLLILVIPTKCADTQILATRSKAFTVEEIFNTTKLYYPLFMRPFIGVLLLIPITLKPFSFYAFIEFHGIPINFTSQFHSVYSDSIGTPLKPTTLLTNSFPPLSLCC